MDNFHYGDTKIHGITFYLPGRKWANITYTDTWFTIEEGKPKMPYREKFRDHNSVRHVFSCVTSHIESCLLSSIHPQCFFS